MTSCQRPVSSNAVILGAILLMILAGAEAMRGQNVPPGGDRAATTQSNPESESPKKVGDIWVNALGMKLAYIPAGEFEMGSAETEAGRDKDESPHHVKISKPFMMATTTVTQAQWKAIMGENPSGFRGDDRPVERVKWSEATAFCEKLGAKEGKHYRLPTEAEWEYACRAGTQTPYSGAENLDEVGWYDFNSKEQTHPVALKKPNAWGLFDMHGNVWQWCSDHYGPYGGDAVDPAGSIEGASRVLRGGSWHDVPQLCRDSFRYRAEPEYRFNFIGFRVCLDL